MPSSRKVQKQLLHYLPKETNEIYELGSGWGNLVFPIAYHLPKSRLHAYELSYIPYFVSIILRKIKKCSNVNLYRKNFFSTSIENADCVVCYLYPEAMKRLKIKFEKELKPGTWVFSNSFSIPGWKPEKIISVDDLWKSEIFIYKINF